MQVLFVLLLSPRNPSFDGKLHMFQESLVVLIKSNLPQRMDLGECSKVHEYALRADYEKAKLSKDYYYDVDVSLECSLPC